MYLTPGATMLRSALRWAIPLSETHDPVSGRSFSLGYSSVSLGRMMARGDPLTAAQIISDYCPSLATREGVSEFLSYARRDVERRKPRRGNAPPGLPLAVSLLSRTRAYCVGEERRLLEQGSVMTWTKLSEHWSGRVWSSLRDDFEVVAERVYRSEKLFICETADFIVKLSKMEDQRR